MRSRAASIRWPPPASSARCSRSFPRASSDTPEARRLPGVAARRPSPATAGRRAAPRAGATRRDTAELLDDNRAAWVQIDEPKFPSSIRQDLQADRRRSCITCACTAGTPQQWWDHAESEDRYNYLYSADELQPIAEKVRDVARRMVKKAYLYLNNHFSAQSVANAVDAEEDARRAGHGAHAAGARRAVSRARRDRRYFASRTVTLTIRSAYFSLSTTSIPEITLPNTVYLPFEPRRVG